MALPHAPTRPRPPAHAAAAGCKLPALRARTHRTRRPIAARATPSPADAAALLLESDGVAVDVADWTRRSFNAAFAELGFDCVRWTPALFADLVRTGDGTGPGLVHTYFNTVGYPTMLATSDRAAFAERVYGLKRKHAAALVAAGDVPLRPGVRDLVDDALAAGARVALLGGTASDPADGVADAARLAFGARDVGLFMVPGAAAGDAASSDDEDDVAPASMEASFAAAAAKVKQAAAAAVVRELAQRGDGDAEPSVVIDQALLAAAAGGPAAAASPQWLAAVAAALNVPCAACAVVGARAALISAARGAGMVAVAAPPRSGSRGTGEFPAAHAVCDGFGPGGGVTWRRLVALMEREG